MKPSIKQNLLLIFLLLFFFGVLYIIANQFKKSDIKRNQSQVSALTDSIRYWKDKDGNNHAEITALNNQVYILGSDILMKDKELSELQELIKKYKIKNKNNSVVNVKAETKFENTQAISKDSIEFNGRTVANIYKFNDDWISADVYSDTDSIHLSAVVRNSYAVILHDSRKNIFSKSKTVAHVINRNPYTEVSSMKAYYVESPPIKKFGVGPNVSYGISSEGKQQVYFGVGVNYNLLRF